MRKRSLVRSLVAGALIGLTEAAPLDAVRRTRPLQVVWIDDRDLPDPLTRVPLFLLDPVPLEKPVAETGPSGFGSIILSTPSQLLHALRARLGGG